MVERRPSREQSPQIFLCLPGRELIQVIQIRSSTVLLPVGGLLLLTIAMSFFIARQITSPYQEELEHVDHSLHSTTQMLEPGKKEFRHAMMKIQEELDLARKMQLNIIPVVSRQYGPVRLTSRYVPAGSPGGDFLDLHDLQESPGFLLADVSGHGFNRATVCLFTPTASSKRRTNPGITGRSDCVARFLRTGTMKRSSRRHPRPAEPIRPTRYWQGRHCNDPARNRLTEKRRLKTD